MSSEKTLREHLEESVLAHREDEAFERALGRFIIAFADAEAELYQVLISYAGVTTAVARALLSSTRTKGMMDFIKSIAHNTDMAEDRSSDLLRVFEQLGSINTMRDHLIHHVSDNYSFDDPKKRVVANVRTTRLGNAKGYEIGAEIIDAMTWDLYAIANSLNMHHGPREGHFRPWREEYRSDEPTPWTYKPPQPIDSWEESPAETRKRQARPQPSQTKQ